MRVLSIDPGFDRMGIAVLENTRPRETVLFSDCITTDREQPFPNRLATIQKAFQEHIKKWKPDVVAIERLYFSKNQKTALRVAESRGIIMSEAAMHGIPVREITPNEIKLAVTGVGNAPKAQVAKMVETLVSLPHKPSYDDEVDAIAVGIAFLALSRYPQG